MAMLDWFSTFQDTIGAERALVGAWALFAALAVLACFNSSAAKRPKDWED